MNRFFLPFINRYFDFKRCPVLPVEFQARVLPAVDEEFKLNEQHIW